MHENFLLIDASWSQRYRSLITLATVKFSNLSQHIQLHRTLKSIHSVIFKPSICVACMQSRLISGQIVKLVPYANALWDKLSVCRGGCGAHKSQSTLYVEPSLS